MDGEINNRDSEPSQRDGSHSQSQKSDQNLEHENPPLVTATLLPEVPEIIINDAEAIQDSVTENVIIQLDEISSGSLAIDPQSPPLSPEILSSRISNSSSSYVTVSMIPFQEQQEYITIPHQVVQIDMVEDQEVVSSEDDETPKLQHQQSHYCCSRMCQIYLSAALIFFFMGIVGMLIINWHFELSREGEVPTPSSSTITTPAVIPVQPPSTSSSRKPSLYHSAMPSCSGLYNPVSSVQIKQSGSDLFTMNNQGTTIVVGNYDYQASATNLETFYINENEGSDGKRTESTEGYSVQSLKLSGDGSRLVLGVNSFPQDEKNDEGLTFNPYKDKDLVTTGGALLQLERGADGHWLLGHKVLTGGGKYGGVFNVATSEKGSIVACSVLGENNTWYVQVYHEISTNDSSNTFLIPLGTRITAVPLDRNSIVELSGNGEILFLATDDGQVRSFEYSRTQNDWVQLGEAMSYQIEPEIRSSYDGDIVALSCIFPVKVFERSYNNNVSSSTSWWSDIGPLDISTVSSVQHVAISGDGRNVVIGETILGDETHGDRKNIARLFRRSGSIFAKIQDIYLKDGLFLGISLDMDGERLSVVVEETVTTFQKDCSVGND